MLRFTCRVNAATAALSSLTDPPALSRLGAQAAPRVQGRLDFRPWKRCGR